MDTRGATSSQWHPQFDWVHSHSFQSLTLNLRVNCTDNFTVLYSLTLISTDHFFFHPTFNLNINGESISSHIHTHTHPSHSQTSRPLSTSLSLGIPFPLVHLLRARFSPRPALDLSLSLTDTPIYVFPLPLVLSTIINKKNWYTCSRSTI